MGLIKAAMGAAGSVLADQWKEYFYCDSLSENVLAARGSKRVSGRSSNTKGTENVISNGSGIAVADGQCMMIVDQGRIAEFTAEPGEFIYDSSAEPSIFAGSFGESLLESFKAFGRRFTFGGDAGRTQMVYYFNTKELIGNKYGTPSPVPFRVIDRNLGLDVEISIRCFGEYSYRLCDPMLFYKNVCGNISGVYTRDTLEGQLKTEVMTALQEAFARISEMGIRYSALPGHAMELADAMNDVLSKKWRQHRGLEIVSFGVSSVKASDEDEAMIKELQRNAVFRDPNMGAAHLVGAQAAAMQAAAKNEGGAMTGFLGMNMAGAAGAANIQSLYQMGQAAAPTGWKCSCGAVNSGNFCSECGSKKPADGWVCSCGSVNKGKFCSNCGQRKPQGVPQYRCDKCGWEPEDPTKPPRFCPECGDPFDSGDIR